MKRLPTFWGQIRIAKISGDEETFWNDLCQRTCLKIVNQTEWFVLWLPNTEPLNLVSPPNLLANVQDKNGHTVGVVRLCWLPAEDHCAEIQFQGTGNAFRSAIKKICSDVDGSLTEGPPQDE